MIPVIPFRNLAQRLLPTLGTLLVLAACSSGSTPDSTTPASPSAEERVELKPGGNELAGIRVTVVQQQDLPKLLNATGEVKVNEYRAAEVTARVAAEVVERHARLGEQVRVGQPLVTLSSAEVATAQGEAQLRAQEWARVRELGEDAVGGRRYLEARVAAEQAQARLQTFGVPRSATSSGRDRQPLGQFTLTAPRAGTILRDAFVAGEHVEPGHELFYIADESAAWIEARLTPAEAQNVAVGGTAQVKIDDSWRAAKVVQKHHALDEATRTIAVRIELPMQDDVLHTGQFVECRIQNGVAQTAIAVPEEALYQGGDGRWAVFVEETANHYRRVPVERQQDLGGLIQVSGLTDGARVVTQGAFFLNAELQKSSFAEEE